MKYILTNEQKERLFLIKSLYDQYKTLDRVGQKLDLTRERVRQLLNQGQKYKLFRYEQARITDFKNVIARVSKDELIKSIYDNPKRFVVCSALNITVTDLFKLLKHYKIDLGDYRYDVRQKKYLLRYSKIVDYLGHHPSTTEMQKVSNWRATWAAISRIWGSFDRFRLEFGIEKPKYNIHPNTILGFAKARQKRQEIKNSKIERVIRLISTKGTISSRQIQLATGYSRSAVSKYLHDLIDQKMITRNGIRVNTVYTFNYERST